MAVNQTYRLPCGRDVEDVLGVPVWAELPLDANLARAVDAGLLVSRVPRSVDKAFDRALAAAVAA